MLFVGCLVGSAAAVKLGHFNDAAAAVVWAAAAVLVDVIVFVAAVSVALATT